MQTYAIAHMHKADMGPEIVEYLGRIDATLAPFGGRFIVYGDPVEVIEGDWPGFAIVIGFPGRDHARAWYRSPAYQKILPLRTRNSRQ
jgi:uncharacterized protein (DUF1330 family)